jgi:hypothetical protein
VSGERAGLAEGRLLEARGSTLKGLFYECGENQELDQ